MNNALEIELLLKAIEEIEAGEEISAATLLRMLIKVKRSEDETLTERRNRPIEDSQCNA